MTIHRHSVRINGHRTSISIEDAFWAEIIRLARARGISTARLITEVDQTRLTGPEPANLSSALRLFVLDAVKARH